MVFLVEDDGEVVAGLGGVAVAPGCADPGFGFGDFVFAEENPAEGIPCCDEKGGAAESVGAGFAIVGGLIEEVEGAAGGGLGEREVEGGIGKFVGGVIELPGVLAGGGDIAKQGFAFVLFAFVEEGGAELHFDVGAVGLGDEAGAQHFFGGWMIAVLREDRSEVQNGGFTAGIEIESGLEGGLGVFGLLLTHVGKGQEAGDVGLDGVDSEFEFVVGDGCLCVASLHGEVAVVAPEKGLAGAQLLGLIELLSGTSPVLSLLQRGSLTNQIGGGWSVGALEGWVKIGVAFGGGEEAELDVVFGGDFGVGDPLVVGVPVGGGDVLLEDLDSAVGGEDALFEFVGDVEAGERCLGVDGGGKIRGPAFGEGHFGVIDFDVGFAEFDGGDGRIFFVDVAEASGRKLGEDAEIVPVAALVALVVVGDVEGRGGVVGLGELGVGDFASEAHGLRDVLHELIPLGGGDGANGLPVADFVLPAKIHDEMGVGGAFVVECSGGFEVDSRGEGWIDWGGFDVGFAGGGDDERLLAANRGHEEAVGRDFGGGVEPDGFAVDVGEVDGVVEGAGRGNGFVEGDAGADEDGVGGDVGGGEHGDEEGSFIFAVAVLIAEDIGGGVGLIAADAEGYADVADLGADEVVDGAGLGVVGGFVGGEGADAGADIVVGSGAGGLQAAIPGSDFGPGVEVGPGDVGEFGIVADAEGGIFVEEEESVFVFAGYGLELGAVPPVDVLVGGFGEGGFVLWTPDLDEGGLGDVEFDGFGEDDGSGRGEVEAFAAPEVSGGLGLGANDAEFVFEVVAGLEAANGNLLLLEVAVEGSLTSDLGGEFLGVGGWGGDDGAVGVANADVVDFDVFGAGGEVEGDDAEGFDGSLVVDGDDAGDFLGTGAVGGVAIDAG